MIPPRSINSSPGAPLDQQRAMALHAAITLRDRSLGSMASGVARRACRTLMRKEALHWRRVTSDNQR